MSTLSIFLATLPGLEATLADEARELGFEAPQPVPGGVEIAGTWAEVWRANLQLRCASRVLLRLWSFRAPHLAQLDRRARKLPWGEIFPEQIALKVEAECRRSRIYHAGAAASRVLNAAEAALGPGTGEPLRLLVRIVDDLATISLDTSGAPLHRRGLKQAVGKAPLRETLAAAFLRQCGHRADEPLIDPMCGSGTLPIEAAEMALGLAPGRARTFAFERLMSFDRDTFAKLTPALADRLPAPVFGQDRDAGAITASRANAERAGVASQITFTCQPISELSPEGCDGPGLVLVNPPYGGRIGTAKRLPALYGALGQVLRERFSGWRVGLTTSEASLARATHLPFRTPGPPIPHGGLKIRLYQTDPLT
ncbi:MAG: class I SAM-dependent RNA methyltransferase [Pseudomonadota bacterium]